MIKAARTKIKNQKTSAAKNFLKIKIIPNQTNPQNS